MFYDGDKKKQKNLYFPSSVCMFITVLYMSFYLRSDSSLHSILHTTQGEMLAIANSCCRLQAAEGKTRWALSTRGWMMAVGFSQFSIEFPGISQSYRKKRKPKIKLLNFLFFIFEDRALQYKNNTPVSGIHVVDDTKTYYECPFGMDLVHGARL